MENQVIGTISKVSKQWWLKVNTKIFRVHPLDGATFPYIITVNYVVDGKEYSKKKWIHAGQPIPKVGNSVRVVYDCDKASKAKILY